MGEAASRVKGLKLSNALLGQCFKVFYYGFREDLINWFPYEDLADFDIPCNFHPGEALATEISMKIFTTCIRPLLLPTGFAAGRIQTPSYEFYHPSVYARQLGFGQVPMSLYFASRIKPREALGSPLEYDQIQQLANAIEPMGFTEYFPHYSCTQLFILWWAEWKEHLFSCRSSTLLAPLSLPGSDTEVSGPDYILR